MSFNNEGLIENLKDWEIQLIFENDLIEIKIDCVNEELKREENKIFWNNCGEYQEILEIHYKEVTLRTNDSCICPIYTIQKGNVFCLSSSPTRLLKTYSNIKIDIYSLCQNLAGVLNRESFFQGINKLEPAAIYKINKEGIQRVQSLLETDQEYSVENVIEMLITSWDKYASTGCDIAIMMSAGFDSRLNFAIATRLKKIYGCNIFFYHEYLKHKEAEIVKGIAEEYAIPLEIYDRNKFKESNQDLFNNSEFLNLTMGFYGRALPRYVPYLIYVRNKHPNGIIMGMASEAHKGRWYKSIGEKNFLNDIRETFGIRNSKIQSIGQTLELNINFRERQNNYYQTLIKNSKAFKNFSSKIDFIHYQTQATQYGDRCNLFQKLFKIPFPVLERNFVSAVLTLQKKDKENFNLITKSIDKINPRLNAIKFVSANFKSLEKRERNSLNYIFDNLLYKTNTSNYYYCRSRILRKGKSDLSFASKEYIESLETKSSLAKKLKEVALNIDNKDISPFIRIDFLQQAIIYLNFIENDLNIRISS